MNKIRNETKLVLGKDEYILRPTFDCMVAIEEATGKALPSFVHAIFTQTVGVKDTVIIIVEGTKAAGKAMSASEASELIQEYGILQVQEGLTDFLTTALYGGKMFEAESKKKLTTKKKRQMK